MVRFLLAAVPQVSLPLINYVERAGFIETGAFDVRIILTEEPKGRS